MLLPPDTHPWKIPVNIAPPAAGDATPITPWKDLFFSPVGLYHLRRWLGVHEKHRNLFTSNQPRFRSADLAWFAGGVHKDGLHFHPINTFHDWFIRLHQATARNTVLKEERKGVLAELQELVFDTATLWDRVSGGSTLIMHVNGTSIPGAPARPEFLKAHVYFPPSLVSNHPNLKDPIKCLVQSFIETVGTQTVANWTAAARNQFNYSLNAPSHSVRPNAQAPTFPTPEPGTSHYIFLGQPASQSSLLAPGLPLSPSTVFNDSPPSSPTTKFSMSEFLPEQYTLLEEQYEKLLEEVKSLQHDNALLLNHNWQLSTELAQLCTDQPRSSSPALHTPLKQTSRHAQSLNSHVSARVHTSPTSPNVTLRASQTKSPRHVDSAMAYPPFGPLPNSISSHRMQSSSQLDPPHTQLFASGSNHYGTPAPPSTISNTVRKALHLLLQTLHLGHLEDSIYLILDHAPSEKRRLMLLSLGIASEVVQKILILSSPNAQNNLDFMEYYT